MANWTIMANWTTIPDCPKPRQRDYFSAEQSADDFTEWMHILCDEIQELGNLDIYQELGERTYGNAVRIVFIAKTHSVHTSCVISRK